MAWLRRPARPHDVRYAVNPKGQRFFETAEEMRARDIQSANALLRNRARGGDLYTSRQADALRRKLEHSDDDEPPPSLAGALYMRDERVCTTGEFWRIAELERGPIITARPPLIRACSLQRN